MPVKREPPEITEKDTEELRKITTELRKGVRYKEPGDNYTILK